jgi:glycerol-3-phosphate dehydrogenase
VFDKSVFNSNYALMIPETKDGRVLFVIPWHNNLLAGTTDTPVEEAMLEPVATEREITFILETMQQYLQTKILRSEIKSIFAGLRPLAASAKQSTKEISRGHKIMVSASGLFSIIGGKWTTYRKMGEDVINAVERHLKWNKTKSITDSLSLTNDDASGYGMHATNNSSNNLQDEIISSNFKLYASSIIYAVKQEMAITVDDMLSRRTRILLLDATEAIRIAPQVAHIMAIALNKNEEWINEQVAAFNRIAGNYVIKDKPPDI